MANLRLMDGKTYALYAKYDPRDRLAVEIGDSKQPVFYPQVKLLRWDNEVNFSARLIDDEVDSPVISSDADKIIWKNRRKEIQWYEVPASKDHPEGAYEFQIDLLERPDTNKIQFTIRTKGLDFFYQPELTAEEIEQGARRAENVVGSYAAYHKFCPRNIAGGKLYRTGKAFHIYRPRIEDSTGAWCWGELNISTDLEILTVTIPQGFLDTAVYPVHHAAGLTIGYDAAGASHFLHSAPSAIISVNNTHTAATGDTITSFSIHGRDTNSTPQYPVCQAAAYTTNTYNRLGSETDVTFTSNTYAWYTSNQVSYELASGNTYCVAFAMKSGTTSFYTDYDDGVPPGRFNTTNSQLLPTLSPTGTDSGRRYSVYASYTVAGGGTDASVTAVVATASAQAIAPTASGSTPNGSVAAVAATAYAAMPAPAVAGQKSATVQAALATATATAIPPAVSTTQLIDAVINAVVATATAVFHAPRAYSLLGLRYIIKY